MLPNLKWTPPEVPEYVREKLNQIWYSLGSSITGTLPVGAKCPVCLEFVYIGERHHNCVAAVSPVFTCIVCLKDERYGSHRGCKQEIIKRREEVLKAIKNCMW